ncbi:RNA-binding protein involved in heterochromatin assembly dri1-like isoform X2 [Cornus florida]|uniref:RNA-binding protein involved in heterochromatin assembly dri1-like isoform X2 n=1 Tax=Cornus florida TaxID=4283 RepID=UPI002898646C|nr:RNA-binding protein involved in heterochromatin assembly dri1-like isoform X2 [Cornus florida]
MVGGEGREGDWECSGCGNRNYAFRSFCNRCKQPRLLVDIKTPADSKWLPRIGDWICTGCTNNNYASREKCKKCGQPKELAAMPAIAIPGASLPTHPHYFARANGGPEQNMNIRLLGNGILQQSLPLNPNWSLGGADKYGLQPASTWPVSENQSFGFAYSNQANQNLMVPKGWRNGDWICNCGFHNYSSRAQCKKCNASMPPALGTKRLASEELVHDWDNKRLNAGHTHGLQQSYPGFEQTAGSGGANQTNGVYTPFPSGTSSAAPNIQFNLQLPHQVTMPTLFGKGAKQWRDGDWMCTNCNNHNYASRSECNRCKTQRDGLVQPVSVA